LWRALNVVLLPGMAGVLKRRKYSKKRKANLRKYTNIKDVEEYIEDVARQEKTGLVIVLKPSKTVHVHLSYPEWKVEISPFRKRLIPHVL